MLGLALAFFVSVYYFVLAIFNFVIFTAYPWFLKKTPFVKNLAVAWLASVSFLAAGFITDIGINISTGLLTLAAVSFVAVVAREIIKDIEDAQGDSLVGLRTLPLVIGRGKSAILAFAFLYAGCALLSVPFLLQLFSIAYLLGAVPAVLLCIYAAKLPAAKAQKVIKIAMYLVFLGFVLGAVF